MVWPLEAVFSLYEAKKLTFDIFKIQNSYLHVKWLEFCQEFNGHDPRHLTCLVWPLEALFSLYEAKKLTFDIFKPQKSYLHVKWSDIGHRGRGQHLERNLLC